jgi:Holliday junction resolvase-like predicted endonuclease
MKQIVIKADEKEEVFNKEKLNTSLLKAGVSNELSSSAANEVDRQFKNRMNTNDIYNRALDHIRKSDPMAALKYTLKKAVMRLGPAGFVFEKYVAKILEQNGYRTEMPQQVLSGFCVDHEVDIIAKRNDESSMVECKFHNIPGNQSDIKVALYVNSRFLDLKKGWDYKNHNKAKNSNNKDISEGNNNNKSAAAYDNNPKNPYDNKLANTYYFTGAWLFTNTKCTSDAIKYANCSCMKITAWNYPEDESLQFYVESKKLYPITILSTLSETHKRKLFEKNILTIKELVAFQIEDLMELLSLDDDYASKIINEICMLSS